MYKLIVGPPGSGKTTEILNFKKNNQNVKVIGYSWILCSQIKGVTFYNLFGIHPNMNSLTERDKYRISNMEINYILIDEIFMFNSKEFDMIVECVKQLKDIKQVIMFGDYMQLKSYESLFFENFGIKNIIIESRNKLYRSFGCEKLSNILINYRKNGKIPLSIFKDNLITDEKILLRDYLRDGWILCSGTNLRISNWTKKLEKIKGFTKLPDGKLYLQFATMKKSVNGLIKGQIIKISSLLENGIDISAFYNDYSSGEEKKIIIYGKRENYSISYPFDPLIISTVHKLQGLTLDKIVIDIKDLFEFNSFYTAISRVRKFDDIKIFCGKNDLKFMNSEIETNENLFNIFSSII